MDGEEVQTFYSDYEDLTYYNPIQILLWGLTCFYMAGDLVIIIWPLWGLMSASQSTSVMGPVFTFKGLFVQCLQYQGGQYQCDNYLKPVFEQPWQLILVRTMGVLSMITACLATGLLLLGLDCCRIWEENPRRKLYVMRFGIFTLLVSGIMLSGVSIFYAAFIKREFSWWKNIPQHTVNTDFIIFDYGGCIYAAFILGLLNYILVFALFQTTLFDKDEFEDEDATVSTSVAEDINSEEDAQILKMFQQTPREEVSSKSRSTKNSGLTQRKTNTTTSTFDAKGLVDNDGFI